jgi:hypothetical protein
MEAAGTHSLTDHVSTLTELARLLEPPVVVAATAP